MEPIYCEVTFSCNSLKGAAEAKYYCNTEQKYVCEKDNEYCHNKCHNWRELTQDEEAGKRGVKSR